LTSNNKQIKGYLVVFLTIIIKRGIVPPHGAGRKTEIQVAGRKSI